MKGLIAICFWLIAWWLIIAWFTTP